MQYLYNFVFYYPLFMAFVLIFGGIIYHFVRESEPNIQFLEETPLVSILIPCHNEEVHIKETIEHLDKQDYPLFEIIAIDDGSRDKTLKILRNIAAKNSRLRIVTLKKKSR